MTRPRSHLALALAAAAAGCTAPPAPDQEATDFPELSVRTETDASGRCWAVEPVPAVYEQVPGQVQVVQAEIADDGTVIRAPIYRNTTVPKVVRPRGDLRFEVPCPPVLTVELVSSLQRALRVRGGYAGPITGAFDPPTVAAVRRYQAARGLDTGRLSLETARALGLIAVPLPDTDEAQGT
ncbi:peptidoglycan-binding protein [Roseivivax marinus]|uniref:peptidoglycan-binding domain-containing protein n=1 Tax=Roseivivax marinus TaxID=1379903 RepID=UPI001F03516B|nr:peptidoglycan-binding domain-containing protein [Roseivivax marinus]UMA63720.1 peptidoglycan-binding protein [Roseivivax marinus]